MCVEFSLLKAIPFRRWYAGSATEEVKIMQRQLAHKC